MVIAGTVKNFLDLLNSWCKEDKDIENLHQSCNLTLESTERSHVGQGLIVYLHRRSLDLATGGLFGVYDSGRVEEGSNWKEYLNKNW